MPLFGPLHLAIIAATVLAAAACVRLVRKSPASGRTVRVAFAIGLAVNELIWYAYRYSLEGFRFPEGLPLELCDLAVWFTVFACLRRSVVAAELVYFAGLGGSAMAVLTPDLWEGCPSYPSVYFFIAHCGVISAIIMLVFGRQVVLGRGAMWRVFGLVNVYVIAIATFNWVFGTNYLYLRRKPESASLLDLFGPWPLYVFAAEAFALGLFAILRLPIGRTSGSAPAVEAERTIVNEKT